MRLTPDQIRIIKETTVSFVGKNARIGLFGSRVDDNKRGGDVDLLIESDRPMPLLEQARLKTDLETKLQLPVDLVAVQRGEEKTAFQRLAKERSVPL